MKITLNLSPAASARDRYALAWAVPATLVGLAALVLLCRASLREYRDYRGMQQQLTEVERRAAELRNQEAGIRRKLEDPGYRELLRRAKFVNALIDQRKLSLTVLSARLAGLLPEDAHLTGLALAPPKKAEDGDMVRIGITARGEDAIETFINDLEDSADFKDVSITNQGFQEESSQANQVNIICTARYLPGVEEEFEASSQPPDNGSAKPAVGSQAAGAKSQKTGGNNQEPKAAGQKTEKGAGHSRAQESTTNRKPNR
jgi:Tfp pilus assembly protein PilN